MDKLDKFILYNKPGTSTSTSTATTVSSNTIMSDDEESSNERRVSIDNLESSQSVDEKDYENCGRSKRKRPKPKMSQVWNFFKKSNDKKLAKCLNCGREYKTSGNTSNLNDHLKRYHPNLIAEPFVRSTNNSSEGTMATSASSSARSSNRSISPFFRREAHYDSNSLRKKELDRSLALMVAQDLQPYNIVNDTGFRSFVTLLNPRYVIPSKYTIREKIMKEMYTEACKALKNILQSTQFVAITTDSWTSLTSESYLTVTCHFITENFTLKSAVLSTKPIENGINHTSENLASALNYVFMEWNIKKKITCIVTDNASNMTKTCDILKVKHLPCYAHTINLVVQDSLALAPVKIILNRCKEIVRFIKSSNIATEIFKSEQNTDTPLKVIQEVPTRWNSAYQMFKRVLKTNEALNRTLLKVKKAPPPLSIEEITILKEIENLLRPFDEATNKVSGSSYVTISLIIPLTFGIYNSLTTLTNQIATDEGKEMYQKLMDSVEKRLVPYEKRTLTQMGTLLDPTFKQEGFRSNDNAKAAGQYLEQEMIYFLNKEESEEKEKGEEPAGNVSTSSFSGEGCDKSRLSTLFSFMNERATQKLRSKKVDAIIIKRQYLERQNTNQDSDPLLFWKVNGVEFHPLHHCALKYLCVPATSVESERVFSTTGQIATERRSRLKPKNVDILTFIKKNVWLTDKCCK
ncbi:zinc finger BED domain-containing protein 1-like [Sitophilus oryzae]|uniref:Zinc finger BED domain-containing protein 1-like n=1 Tax=Sitophilus oryzae TaxID=7048 RepID=A0A6J2XYH4_SITOR|nr:zinc finger BED domain-containing protein 1-like [Sitophilus oryzae]